MADVHGFGSESTEGVDDLLTGDGLRGDYFDAVDSFREGGGGCHGGDAAFGFEAHFGDSPVLDSGGEFENVARRYAGQVGGNKRSAGSGHGHEGWE